jgi:hypothetical protein
MQLFCSAKLRQSIYYEYFGFQKLHDIIALVWSVVVLITILSTIMLKHCGYV